MTRSFDPDAWAARAKPIIRSIDRLRIASHNSPGRHLPFGLFLLGIVAYGASFAWQMLVHFDLVNIIHDVNTDDSFYYFQIARNLAAGKFSTFDGGITRTNGYHPIWLLLITPFYWVFDPERALFAIKVLEIMLMAGGVAIIALAARLARLPWVLLFATLPILYRIRALFLGLEAAAALFWLSLLFLALVLFARNPRRWQWPLAAIAFSLPWVRLEYMAISVAATGAVCLIEWLRPDTPGGSGPETSDFTPLRTFIPLIGACAGILIYFAYNKMVFGGILPVSAAVKEIWAQDMWQWKYKGGYDLAQNVWDFLQTPFFDDELLAALAICACLPLVCWFVRRARVREERLLLFFMVGAFSLAAGHLAKFVQTVLIVPPSFLLGYASWSFVPAYLMMALVVPVGCYVAIFFIRRFIGSKSRSGSNILSLGVVVGGVVFPLMQTDFAEPFRWVDIQSESTNVNRRYHMPYYEGVRTMNRVLSEGSIIGSWDAGVIGYFSRFPVVNLDGLVNSYEYLRGYRHRDSFFAKFGITHFAGGKDEDIPDNHILFKGAMHTFPNGVSLSFRLWSATPLGNLDSDAWFWRRMEPHFDYHSGDVGVVFDGRLTQAFVRDCAAPGLRDTLIVFSWPSESDETAVRPWHSWGRTRGERKHSLCADVLLLPRDAAHPLRVETMSADHYLAELLDDSRPIIRSAGYDVYLIGNSLIYVKGPCAPADTEAHFFLHLIPADEDDLPEGRKQYGFDNLDFAFDWRGARFEGKCMTTVTLPDYAITRIRTGQYIPEEGQVWNAEFSVGQ